MSASKLANLVRVVSLVSAAVVLILVHRARHREYCAHCYNQTTAVLVFLPLPSLRPLLYPFPHSTCILCPPFLLLFRPEFLPSSMFPKVLGIFGLGFSTSLFPPSYRIPKICPAGPGSSCCPSVSWLTQLIVIGCIGGDPSVGEVSPQEVALRRSCLTLV